MGIPPMIPQSVVYTPYYCEENVYILSQELLRDPKVPLNWNLFVVFISNTSKTVLLWSQKIGKPFVVWDYHVILLLLPNDHGLLTDSSTDQNAGEAWIYDFDTTLPTPSSFQGYVQQTFNDPRGAETVPNSLSSLFRIVTAQSYLDHFASDRSHMDLERWPAPQHPVLCGTRAREQGITHNLMSSYVDMEEGADHPLYGKVLNLESFMDLSVRSRSSITGSLS